MSEQAVQVLQVVPGSGLDTAVGEQAHGLVSFVDSAGAPVDVGGSVIPDPPATAGDYNLRAVVDSDGGVEYVWASTGEPDAPTEPEA